ncbi:hypothetical protein DMH15_37470, partial [Streptomyces sp. WAC 06725]
TAGVGAGARAGPHPRRGGDRSGLPRRRGGVRRAVFRYGRPGLRLAGRHGPAERLRRAGPARRLGLARGAAGRAAAAAGRGRDTGGGGGHPALRRYGHHPRRTGRGAAPRPRYDHDPRRAPRRERGRQERHDGVPGGAAARPRAVVARARQHGAAAAAVHRRAAAADGSRTAAGARAARTTEHIDAKVEAAKQSGREVTVYLLDGTTGPYLVIVLAVLLIGGGLYEVLPTAKWGHTLGKKLCGVRVLDIEGHDTPPLSSVIKRWLVYGVLGVLAVGIVNAVWCLFDRPWRQCWHDKLARTFVAEK